MRAGLTRRVRRWRPPASTSVDLAQLLTLVVFVYYAGDPDFPGLALAPISMAVAIAGLVWPGLRRARLFWLYVLVAAVWARLPGLLVIDNHHYLIAWWCLALLACRLATGGDAEAAEPLVARNARALLGLAMAFAVAAKLRSGEFVDGSFFEFLLLAGKRFDAFTQIVAGVPSEVLEANRQAVASLMTSGVSSPALESVALQGGDRVRLLAEGLSWWTLAIESAAAVLFLWPANRAWLRGARNAVLLAFCVSTYAIATVGGFAWILLILGIAQCEPEDRLAREAYCVVFLLVLVYTLPFGDWITPLAS